MDSKTILLHLMFPLVGTPYRWGGDDAIDGFDCSGLVIELLKAVGVLPEAFDATAQGLRQRFPAVSPQEAKFGDLVFFGTPALAGHVGMYLGSGLMLEAGGGDSTTTTDERAAKQNAFVRVRPVSRRADRLGYARPAYKDGAA